MNWKKVRVVRKIKSVKQLTKNPYLNMYQLDIRNDEDKKFDYYVASRAKCIEDAKFQTKKDNADGVFVFCLYRDDVAQEEKMVLVRQYRCSIDGWIYEYPAGLVDEGEDYKTAGKRELKEETGLDFMPLDVDDMYTKPRYTSIGMTDEACGIVYGYATGEISKEGQEETEEIDIILANREEVRRILKEERIAVGCAYMMMHFLNTEEGHVFDFLKSEYCNN